MRISPHSLFFKIFFGLWLTIMIFALTPLVFMLLSSKDHREAFYNLARKELDKQVVVGLRKAAERSDEKMLQKNVRIAENRLNMHIYVFDRNGKEIYGKKYPKNTDELLSEMKGGRVVLIKRFSEDPRDNRVIRVLKAGPYILVGYPEKGVPHRYVKMIVTQHLHILLYIFLLSLIASLILVRYFTRPLTKLSSAAEKIAEGDFTVRVSEELKRKDEIGVLAEDFDAMADRLQTAKEDQEQMLRSISHELRSPLTRLRLSLELARAKAGEKAEPALDRIEKESERLNEMIGWLLNISRLKASGKMSRTVVADEVIAAVVPDWEFEAAENGKELICTMDSGCCVRGNAERLISGLENIVRNAIRYAKKTVRLDIAKKNGKVTIVVSDDGDGVDEKHLQHIFSPFYRVHDDRDRKTGGTGLGLSIAKTAVDAHGGNIRGFNSPSGGLTVEIILPELNSGSRKEAGKDSPDSPEQHQ